MNNDTMPRTLCANSVNGDTIELTRVDDQLKLEFSSMMPRELVWAMRYRACSVFALDDGTARGMDDVNDGLSIIGGAAYLNNLEGYDATDDAGNYFNVRAVAPCAYYRDLPRFLFEVWDDERENVAFYDVMEG